MNDEIFIKLFLLIGACEAISIFSGGLSTPHLNNERLTYAHSVSNSIAGLPIKDSPKFTYKFAQERRLDVPDIPGELNRNADGANDELA
jgi:hypothetical protein